MRSAALTPRRSRINSATGVVTINATPDFESKSAYNFTVKAADPSGLFNAEAVTLNINDLPPVISSASTASVNEGVAAGTAVYTAMAADPAGGTVTYALSGADASAFTINSSTGVVTINATPDFETKSTYNFTVKAADPSGLFNTEAVTLNINDLPPVIISVTTASVNEGVAAGTTVYTAMAADPAGGTVTYVLSGADARRSRSTRRPASSPSTHRRTSRPRAHMTSRSRLLICRAYSTRRM